MIPTRRFGRVTKTAHTQQRRAHCSLCQISGDAVPVPDDDLSFHNLMIRACCLLGDERRAQAWYARMAANGIEPDVQSFLPILSFYAEKGDVGSVYIYLKAMAAAGVLENSCTQHALMKAYQVQGDIRGVLRVMADMRDRGFPISEYSYCLLIHTCAKFGLLADAEAYVAEMEKEGIEPTLTTYNCVINACTKRNDMKRAQMWFAHMTQKGIVPNVVTYGTLCKGFAHFGDVEAVVGFMQDCKAHGHHLNEYLYVSLLIACERSGQPNEQHVQRAFLDMVQSGIQTVTLHSRFLRLLGRERVEMLQRTAQQATPNADEGADETFTILGALSL